MFKIRKKEQLSKLITLLEIDAPLIARKAQPGQFVIIRVDDHGERIPLTIADFDIDTGTITIIIQAIGKTTKMLSVLEVGDSVLDLVGPLGMPTKVGNPKKVAVIGGGVGCAIAYPQAKSLFNSGVEVDIIAGFKDKDFVIIEDRMEKVSDNLYITTDDGSYGEKGFVTNKLSELIKSGKEYNLVIAIGPVPMMRSVAEITKKYGIKTIVSLNPIMIDGTGMCGGCRVTVGGKIKFACVDGPDFDGHQVDFEELMLRNSTYRESERKAHTCRLDGGAGKDV
ncbi:MAG: sulfide/dihydroorotate dehydrogenase-like FAD/NAD-binding protein [Clostridiales bacterium]|nr:sulfide/dihydroorotate dehydrogenase-like FAD/NAD-binding protein [Clostridiales bacterium]